MHGVGDGRSRRNGSDLAYPFGSKRPLSSGVLDQDGHDFRHVIDPGDFVAGQGIGADDALLDLEFLQQGVADAHHHSALDLAFQGQGIDGPAHVVGGDDLQHTYFASFGVHLYLGSLGGISVGEVHIAFLS